MATAKKSIKKPGSKPVQVAVVSKAELSALKEKAKPQRNKNGRFVSAKAKPATPPPVRMVNHVILVRDVSISMSRHQRNLNDSTAKLIKTLGASPIDTRVSLVTFGNTVSVRFMDTPANIVNPPHMLCLESSTRLCDAIMEAVRIGNQILTANQDRADEDHTILVDIVTDGEENASSSVNRLALGPTLAKLSDRWTISAIVPNQYGVNYAKNIGIPAGNIAVWDTSAKDGYEEVALTLNAGYSNYANARSAGFTKSSNLFQVNAANVNQSTANRVLDKVPGQILFAEREYDIRSFAEAKVGRFVKGAAFYELKKKETVQPYKELVIVHKTNGARYGGPEARKVLGLPSYQVPVIPGNFGEWDIFVQSTSVNRKIPTGTRVFIKS